MVDAGPPPGGQMMAGFLGFRAKDGVAAADIGQYGMDTAVAIP